MTIIRNAGNLTVPSEILTLEKLSYWSLLAMYQMYGNLTFAANVEDRQAKRIDVTVGKAFDNKNYAVFAVSFELDPTIITSNPTNRKPWNAAFDWGNVELPAAFNQNSPT
jgi:hypothetical protein